MSLKDLLLSPKGRVNRSTYWLKYMVPYLVLSIIAVVADISMGLFDEATGIGVISLAFMLVALYPSIAISIKRCHDRGRTGWFNLVAFIPIVNIWYIIEMLFLKGTEGGNKYGEVPAA